MNQKDIQDETFEGVFRHEDINNLKTRKSIRQTPRKKLGEWYSTAICGNDIASSCLYVSAISIAAAGKLAPIVLLCVGLVLYLFRKVYSEVLSALPLNGGAYNALLNTTTKFKASIAACLTLLSYLATAVISASEAIHYAHNLIPSLPVELSILGLLTFFAILTICGIGESARVALVIFVIHITTLIVLCSFCIFTLFTNPSIFLENLNAPLPNSWPIAIIFGFATAFLGVSGFESSANFIEEQKKGIFPKTLRNMWLIVIVFNPLLAFLALSVVPHSALPDHREDLLAYMGMLSGGELLNILVSLSAMLVLSGAVLTAFVGSNGLMKRMSLDGCLPQFLLKQTKWHTDYVAIIGFWLLCCSIFVVTQGQLANLATVYTLSFLSVMALFATGNMLLKLRRERLPRETKATWYEVGIAMISVLIGLAGNILMGRGVQIFLNYFVASVLIVSIMLLRTQILLMILQILRDIFTQLGEDSKLYQFISRLIKQFSRKPVVYFTRGDDLANLNRALLYIQENESSRHIQIIHVYEEFISISKTFKKNLRFLHKAYPDIRIDLLTVKGHFGPEIIQALSRQLHVPVNYMFISCPGDSFPHNVAELGGVRVIV